MPYQIKKINGNKYQVKNVKSGEIHAKGTSKSKAQRQVRLLNMIDGGYKPGMRNV